MLDSWTQPTVMQKDVVRKMAMHAGMINVALLRFIYKRKNVIKYMYSVHVIEHYEFVKIKFAIIFLFGNSCSSVDNTS